MKRPFDHQLKRLMLPGLKRWICISLLGITVIVIGALLLLGYHPITVTGMFLREVLEHAADVLPHKISGFMVVLAGAIIIFGSTAKMIKNVLRAYVADSERESIPDILFKRRHLDRGPRVVVIGGGTGLSTLLRGLKHFTANITAVVTVGDDGGSSGRLRQALGVVPPGDIRNCITALADEEKLVTELFSYRFQHGEGLEGHSFGNLFLTAVYAMTDGDMLEAARVAGRVLNSRGTVLPSTQTGIQLIAEMTDGSVQHGESNIPLAGGKIKRLTCEPSDIKPTPEALEAIMDAELIVLGPGSLYTSIIPNLLIPGIADSIKLSPARKIYVSNVLTQAGETQGYTVADHLQALFDHSKTTDAETQSLIEAVIVNDCAPAIPQESKASEVFCDAERVSQLGVGIIRSALVGEKTFGHHDPQKLAKSIMEWFLREKKLPRTAKPHNTIIENTPLTDIEQAAIDFPVAEKKRSEQVVKR